MTERAVVGSLAGHHRSPAGVAGLTAVAVQVDNLAEVGKRGQVSSVALGAGLAGVDIDRPVRATKFYGMQVAGAVAVRADLPGTRLAGGDGITHRVIYPVMAVANRAGIAASLADMNPADGINRIMAAAAIKVGADIMVVTGVRAILVGMAGGTIYIVGAADGGGDNGVIGR